MSKEIYGTAGDDFLEYLHPPGADVWITVFGGAGNDTIRVAHAAALGEAGNDTIIGVAIPDEPWSPYSAGYGNSPAGVDINFLTNAVQDGYGSTDTLVNISRVSDSAHDDRVTGSMRDEFVSFSAGNDSFVSGGGQDTVTLSGMRSSHAITTYDIAADVFTVTDTGLSSLGAKTLKGVYAIDFSGMGSDLGRIRVGATDSGGASYTGAHGQDIVRSGAWHDFIDGMDGKDTVVYSGKRADFTVTKGESVTTVSGALGNDRLTNIERIVFDDKAVAFDTLDFEDIPGQVYRLYQAAFDRTPDGIGIGFWISRLEQGVLLRTVSNSFVESPEFRSMYSGAGNHELVSRLYLNILDRAGEQSGIDFWAGVLDRKEATMAEVLEGFSNTVEFIAKMVGVMANGIEYIPYGG